ncbi:ubiquinone biosynthesis accessory factor UbiJ [Leeia oryzae]|uniref:ubiquinone biosynthesis accessory factor UbiJ n=1 Tax=Leeia oryzae TaxID=356662 RepID=UPI00036F6454|nr:hypothetical protein [Leeia oryzae]
MIQSAGFAVIQHLLAQQPELLTHLLPHAGKTVCLSIPPVRLTMIIHSDGALSRVNDVNTPDATLHCPFAELPKLLGDTATRRSAMQIEGDAQLAADVGMVIQSLQWDATADLASIVGDAAAVPIARWAKAELAQTQQLSHSWLTQFATYMRDEAHVLADPFSVQRFIADVDTLRDDVARLSARIAALEARRNKD